MNVGTIVKDDRGHLYRVLETEPTFRNSRQLRVQPVTRWKNGTLHDRGDDEVINERFVRDEN